MVTYSKFIENVNYNLIKLDEDGLQKYSKKLYDYIYDLNDSYYDSIEKAKSMQIDLEEINKQLNIINYPFKNNLIRSIKSKNHNYIDDQVQKIYTWYRSQNTIDLNIRSLIRHLQNISVHYKPEAQIDVEQETKLSHQEIYNKSVGNMHQIFAIIQNRISNLDEWNIPVIISIHIPNFNHYEDNLNPISAATVYLDDKNGPSFTFFLDGNSIEIDDVLDADDYDFFPNDQIKSAYFQLIKEIKSPGSSSKPGKIITLYTARPVSDREFYRNTQEIPANIYLTNNYSHAIGLGQDLHGPRDIWKIRMDDRYLIKTMDTGLIKYYQVVGSKSVPIRSIYLVDEASQ